MINPTLSTTAASIPVSARPARITSIDALRGLVMFTMIVVNDLAGAGKIVPDWMVHFSDRHRDGSGMTFVDLVFPAFLFIVGMSLPFALRSYVGPEGRLGVGLRHIVLRTLSLLCLGVLMVNESPDSAKMGWSATVWSTLLYFSAIAAFCEISPSGKTEATVRRWRIVSGIVRMLGLASLVFLAVAFVGRDGHRMVSFSPFTVHTEWWGILGLIGWAYLVGAIVFLLFRDQRTALLGCMVLLLCLYPAERAGMFNGFWLASYVGFGGTLGSQAAIVVGGLLLASILVSADTTAVRPRVRFTLLFIGGTAAGAILIHSFYGISKNSATPSWCLWACAVTAAFWLGLYLISDVWSVRSIAKPLAVAGQNVLLAYLLSEMLPSALDLLHLGDWYGGLAGSSIFSAVARSSICALALLGLTAWLNRLGFRLKL